MSSNPSPHPPTAPRPRSNLRFGVGLYRRLSALRTGKHSARAPVPTETSAVRRGTTLVDVNQSPAPDEPPPPDGPRSLATENLRDSHDAVDAGVHRHASLSALSARDAPDVHEPEEVYALDSSPAEDYDSRNVRAGRVATALERISKQAWLFGDGEAHDTAPQEALIPLVVESMVQHCKDPKVADRGLTTLRRLTVSEVCRERIGECGGIEAVVEVMRAHSLRVRIQTQACLALANLAYRCPENKEKFLACNGLKEVVAALSIHRRVEHVQAWGCLAIRNITNAAAGGGQDASVAAGAIEVLVCALELYPRSSVVQEQSMIALTNIAKSSSLGMDRIRSVGGIQSLITSMHNNVRSASLSETALACAKIMVEDQKNQEIFGHDRGIEAITAVLDEHQGHLGIAIKGCIAFRHLAYNRNNREVLGKCGGIRAIISAMSATKATNSNIAGHLLKALSNSTFDSVANKTLAGRLGGIEATLTIMFMEPFKEDVMVVEDACRVLRNLTDGVVLNQRLMVKTRGMVAVQDAARILGPFSSQVAEHSVAIFVNLMANRATADRLRDSSADLSAVVKRLSEAHSGNEYVQRQISDLMSILDPLHNEVTASSESNWRGAPGGERDARSSNSLHRLTSRGGEPLTRLQRLRSLPLTTPRQSGF